MALAYWFVTLGLLVLAGALAAVWLWRRPRRSGTGLPIANSERLTALPGYRRALRRSTLLFSLAGLVLAVLLAVTAVAAGRWVYQRVETPERYNRDIVLCLDVSGSMVDYDVEVIDRYLEMLPGFRGERMSLVLWDSTAVQVFPLTDDYTFVTEQLQRARDGMHGYGDYWYGTRSGAGASLVGDGLAACALMFDGAADDGRSRSIILATDNAINGSPFVALPDAAAYAQEQRITIYGLDANEYEDAYSDEYRTSVLGNGGLYYKLTDPAAVAGIVDQITSDQTSVVRGAPQVLVIDQPQLWLTIMLLCFIAYLPLAWRLRR